MNTLALVVLVGGDNDDLLTEQYEYTRSGDDDDPLTGQYEYTSKW